MIFTLPLFIVFLLIRGLLFILPDTAGLPDSIGLAMEYVFGFLYAFDFIVSVDVILTVLGISLAFELAIQVWHGIHWLLAKIPILNIK